MSLNESIIEDATLERFGELGYAIGHEPHMAPGELESERATNWQYRRGRIERRTSP